MDAQTFFELPLRFEKIIHVPSAFCDPESRSETVEDFIADLPEHPNHPLYATCPRLAHFAGWDEFPSFDQMCTALEGLNGFLVQAATPVMRPTKGTACHFSWGYFATAWIYGADFEAAATAAVEWAKARHERDLKPATEPAQAEG